MHTATLNSPSEMGHNRPGFFARTEAWLDARGRAAWITAMVGSYIVFWPVGLAMTAYMVINNKFSGPKPDAAGAAPTSPRDLPPRQRCPAAFQAPQEWGACFCSMRVANLW